MIRIALITSAVAVAAVCGGIGLSVAHSAISSRAALPEDSLSPVALQPRAVPETTTAAFQAEPEGPHNFLAQPSHRIESDPSWVEQYPSVTQNAIEDQGFGSLLAPRIGDRPKPRPYTQISSAQTLVISSPMHTSQRAPRPTTRAQHAPRVQNRPIPARRIGGGVDNGSLIGVFR